MIVHSVLRRTKNSISNKSAACREKRLKSTHLMIGFTPAWTKLLSICLSMGIRVRDLSVDRPEFYKAGIIGAIEDDPYNSHLWLLFLGSILPNIR